MYKSDANKKNGIRPNSVSKFQGIIEQTTASVYLEDDALSVLMINGAVSQLPVVLMPQSQ